CRMPALPGTGRATVGGQRRDLPVTACSGDRALGPGKKTAEAIQQEIAREVEQLLCTIFTGMRKTGSLDLEAVEMLVCSAMHQAGAKTLTELLRFPVPDQRAIPCPCGQPALFQELRSKTVLTAVGAVEVL